MLLWTQEEVKDLTKYAPVQLLDGVRSGNEAREGYEQITFDTREEAVDAAEKLCAVMAPLASLGGVVQSYVIDEVE